MIVSDAANYQIPVRDVSDAAVNPVGVSAHIPEELMVPHDRSNAIETALSRFRSGVERVYSESKERSLGRLRDSEDEMSRRFQISTVQNNDKSELQKIGTENMTRFMNAENQEMLEEASKLDCYVIREQIKSSQNREDEEERVYREEIEKLKRKNTELEQRIKQKKRLNEMDNGRVGSTNFFAAGGISASTAAAPIGGTNATVRFSSSTTSNANIGSVVKPAISMPPPPIPTPFPTASFKAATTFDTGIPPAINKSTTAASLSSGLDIDNFVFPSVNQSSNEAPEVQVIFEGKQRDLSRCLRKFAKKIFYLQKQMELLVSEKNKWKTEYEVIERNSRELTLKHDESVEMSKLNEKKLHEIRVEAERYKTLAVSLEEELTKVKNLPAVEPEIQIIEKIIEKPIEIIKHVILEKIVEKPIEIIKTIEVPPVENEKLVEKIVEVPVEKIIEKIVHVPHEVVIEKLVEVPKIEIVEREKIVEVPRIEYMEKIVYVDKPVYMDKPVVSLPMKEVVETRDFGAERELNFLRDDYRKLQLSHDGLIRQIDEFKIKLIQQEDIMRHADVDRTIHFEADRNALIEEIKNNHITIDDLRGRIESLYKEITTLSDSNNRKNLEMTNQIRLLEDQLAAYCVPRVISTVVPQSANGYVSSTYLHNNHYDIPTSSQHVSSTAYFKNHTTGYAADHHSLSTQQQPLRENNYYYSASNVPTQQSQKSNVQNNQQANQSHANQNQSAQSNKNSSEQQQQQQRAGGNQWNENGIRYQM